MYAPGTHLPPETPKSKFPIEFLVTRRRGGHGLIQSAEMLEIGMKLINPTPTRLRHGEKCCERSCEHLLTKRQTTVSVQPAAIAQRCLPLLLKKSNSAGVKAANAIRFGSAYASDFWKRMVSSCN